MESEQHSEICVSPILNKSTTELKGIGPQLAKRLAKLNIHSILDLLFHLPSRYQDRTHISLITEAKPGDFIVIEGVVTKVEVMRTGRKSLLCYLADASGSLALRFFHYYPNQQQQFSPGAKIRCFGEVRRGPSGLEMVHPEWRKILPGMLVEIDEHLTPIYPTTEGITQQRLREIISQALELLKQGQCLPELLPASVLKKMQYISLAQAIYEVHRPAPDASLSLLAKGRHPAQRRLVFEELLAHHLSLRRLRFSLQAQNGCALPGTGEFKHTFLTSLPFELTAAQQRVSEEVARDLASDQPMLRLVQGDVGCGKTAVAALAMLQAVESGFQAVLMAPTEILAEQHFQNFSRWLTPLGIKVAWLTGRLNAKTRREMEEKIVNGVAQVVVGTHALFQEHIKFHCLGLVIIDEQHRFGVHQRLALREKGKQGIMYPHQLVMTATPIPRTLAMLFYADLDCSMIDELPPGRQPVRTVVVANTKRNQVIERVRNACMEKRQVYWVCTLIEESESLQCQAAEKTAAQLVQALPEFNIGLIHGRLKAAEKETIMQQFKQGDIDLLVATTVIEVGVDVPNASLMIIENPERLGLSQLHQLRGRVGRGDTDSYCVLLYQTPLSKVARKRLSVMRDTTDGFAIAQLDLELRGAGEVLGTRQTGVAQFRVADLERDKGLMPEVQTVAQTLFQEKNNNIDAIIQRWLGDGERYGRV